MSRAPRRRERDRPPQPSFVPLGRARTNGKCPVSGKVSYPTAYDAALALGKARSGRPVKGRDAKVEQRHYPCPDCKQHHLTSVA